MRTRADALPDSSLIDWAARSASVMSRSDWSGFQAASVFAMSMSAAALDALSMAKLRSPLVARKKSPPLGLIRSCSGWFLPWPGPGACGRSRRW